MQTVASTNLSRSRRREMKVVSLSATYPYPSSLISSITTVQRRRRQFSSGGHPTPELSLRRALSEESQEVLGRLLQTPQKQGLFLSLHLHFLSPFFTSWLSDSLLPTWVFVFALFCSSSSRIGITWKKTGVITFLMILVAQMEIRRSF